eukprot:TRINITY_DN4289_c0_g1_i8.p1 TRINITY_DN4289_c0_g1~~TRINITY_DN4289_c0_g1_i8.p1  ORF type:complete len:153 (+),score=17.46 TRINITY_DN4289_c0_g1_i8:834-1292(+)
MPEPDVCRERVWVPFIRQQLGVDDRTILVGHSSGANAVLRLLEEASVFGAVMVSAGRTQEEIDHPIPFVDPEDIEYYSKPIDWEKIKSNARWILHLHSSTDEVVPFAESQIISAQLGSDVVDIREAGHFVTGEFPCTELVVQKIRDNIQSQP